MNQIQLRKNLVCVSNYKAETGYNHKRVLYIHKIVTLDHCSILKYKIFLKVIFPLNVNKNYMHIDLQSDLLQELTYFHFIQRLIIMNQIWLWELLYLFDMLSPIIWAFPHILAKQDALGLPCDLPYSATGASYLSPWTNRNFCGNLGSDDGGRRQKGKPPSPRKVLE